MAGHNKFLLATIAVNVLVMLFSFSLSALDDVKELFPLNMRELSDRYDSSIKPTSATFSIWGAIYVWQALLIIFAIVNIFRKTEDGPAYVSPLILPPAFFISYTCSYISSIIWSFLFAREYIVPCFVFLFFIAFPLYVCMVISCRNLYDNAPFLIKQNRKTEVWLHRIFVHNGLGIFASWTTIATLLNLATMLAYRTNSGLDLHLSGTVSLSILSAEIIVFVVTDFFFFDKYTRYTITPYFVVIVALVGSIVRNWDDTKINSIFTAVLLGIGIVAAIAKATLMLYRHFTKPIYPVAFSGALEKNPA